VKILLDEDLPTRLRLHIPDHEVFTVRYVGWLGMKNGELLRAAEEAGFEVFVTGDKKLSREQNLTGRKIAVVVLSAQKMDQLRPYLQEIVDAISRSEPGIVLGVDCSGASRS
jgi:predicted nuclease of predicted toxin-antitoxin system